jgi:hypothetical protein
LRRRQQRLPTIGPKEGWLTGNSASHRESESHFSQLSCAIRIHFIAYMK